jgi:outer membrane protein assembly factor BamB
MQPGTDGGCEWPPAAYSPRTKFIYYGTRYEPMIFEAVPEDTTGFGSSIVPVVPGVQARGIFGALDTTTGRVAWKIDIPDQPTRSGVVVAGDLVFFGQNDGTFKAFDAESGVVLWSFDGTSVPNGGGANAAPIAYVIDGKEFIANAFGGNRLERTRRTSPLGDALIVFGLPSDGYTGPNVVHAAQSQ